MDNKTLDPRPVDYKFWRDSKMMGMILLIFTVTLQIFAFVKVPGFSTINAYTVGMLFGAANPLFYLYIIYIALTKIFRDSTKIASWMKLTKVSYWFVAISVVFIVASAGHYQHSTSWKEIGTKNFKVMGIWFDEFTSESAWYPASIWGGALGAFLYSSFAALTSGIGALVIAIGMGIISLSFLVTGTSVGLYKGMIKKKKTNLAKIEIRKEDVKIEEEEVIFDKKQIQRKQEKTSDFESLNPFPFDDPFK